MEFGFGGLADANTSRMKKREKMKKKKGKKKGKKKEIKEKRREKERMPDDSAHCGLSVNEWNDFEEIWRGKWECEMRRKKFV